VSQAPNGIGSASGEAAGIDGSLADATNTAAAAHAFGTAHGNGGGVPTMNGIENGTGNGTSAFASPLRTKPAGSAKPVSSGSCLPLCLATNDLTSSGDKAADVSPCLPLQPALRSCSAANNCTPWYSTWCGSHPTPVSAGIKGSAERPRWGARTTPAEAQATRKGSGGRLSSNGSSPAPTTPPRRRTAGDAASAFFTKNWCRPRRHIAVLVAPPLCACSGDPSHDTALIMVNNQSTSTGCSDNGHANCAIC
jgi:hypothetical protein